MTNELAQFEVRGNQYFIEGNVTFGSEQPGSWLDEAMRSFVGGIAGRLGSKLADGIVNSLRTTDARGRPQTFDLNFVGGLYQSFDGYWFFCTQTNVWWTWVPFLGWVPPRAIPQGMWMAH